MNRKREEELAKAHQKEMDAAVAESLRETQTLLSEFNRSKELLSDKISALQFMWVIYFTQYCHTHSDTHVWENPPTHTCTYLHHILTELCELVMFYQMWTTKCMIQRLWAYIYWACASERGGHRLYYTWHYYRLKDWPNNFSCETCRPKHSGTCVKGCNSPLTNEAVVILDMFGLEMYLYL